MAVSILPREVLPPRKQSCGGGEKCWVWCSGAVGRNPIPSYAGDNRNIDLVTLTDNWPRLMENGVEPWRHSDLKDVAYTFNRAFYEESRQRRRTQC